ncbi:hypothetical protein BKA82DRAFT_4203983 [Pisolithus tinctorius]|nr:hypothetical protein BKA82DRAFT_4203983 [Pisolithus tinctorius]
MKLSLSLSLVEMKRQYLASTRAPKAILTLLASIFRLCITVKKKACPQDPVASATYPSHCWRRDKNCSFFPDCRGPVRLEPRVTFGRCTLPTYPRSDQHVSHLCHIADDTACPTFSHTIPRLRNPFVARLSAYLSNSFRRPTAVHPICDGRKTIR